MGVADPSVTAPVALPEGAVEQNVIGISFAQETQQAGPSVGELIDDSCGVSVGGADGDTETGGDLGEAVVLRRYTRPASARWCGGNLQRRSPPRLTMSMVTHSTGEGGRSAAENQRGSVPVD
ncbi:hypothetical protein GCM10010244_42490 [Streptomyces coeruleorubidus]|nr:hypothetical protein GCM10010244_42490 [Streptomyces bellus]